MSDNVNSPKHYNQGKIECIDYIKDNLTNEQFEGFCIGNVIKYITRFKSKNGLEDLKKASWYLNTIICRSCIYEDEYREDCEDCKDCLNGSNYIAEEE
jgi:hypothetical protein